MASIRAVRQQEKPKQAPTQKVSLEMIKKMTKLGLFDGHNISFEKAIERAVSFCEENQDFKKWLEKKKDE